MANNIQQSTATVTHECDVSTTTAKKYLKRRKIHSHKVMMLYDLNEDEFGRSMHCEVISKQFITYRNCIKNILTFDLVQNLYMGLCYISKIFTSNTKTSQTRECKKFFFCLTFLSLRIFFCDWALFNLY